jgi:hypothetical protein
MRIISKYKDYYDYLTGIYGEDPKLVLDRRVSEQHMFWPSFPEKIVLHICDKIVEGFWDSESFYFGETLGKFGKINTENKLDWFERSSDKVFVPYVGVHFKSTYGSGTELRKINVETTDDLQKRNTKLGCPILFNGEKFEKFPILGKMNVGSVLPPEVIYKMLVDWLSARNSAFENRPDTRSDVDKLISRGFDKKESFRKM